MVGQRREKGRLPAPVRDFESLALTTFSVGRTVLIEPLDAEAHEAGSMRLRGRGAGIGKGSPWSRCITPMGPPAGRIPAGARTRARHPHPR